MLSAQVQNIIVYVIGIVIAVYILFGIYKLLSGRRNPCASCGKECGLRTEMERLSRSKKSRDRNHISALRKELSQKSKSCSDMTDGSGNCCCK